MMRYEIVNPSDKCFISADDVRLAKVACAMLGYGIYGLKDADDQLVMGILEPLDEAVGLKDEAALVDFIDRNKPELAKVFRSFEYEGEQTSLNDIGGLAARFAAALEAKEEDNAHV